MILKAGLGAHKAKPGMRKQPPADTLHFMWIENLSFMLRNAFSGYVILQSFFYIGEVYVAVHK
jgi:hypothetical protein